MYFRSELDSSSLALYSSLVKKRNGPPKNGMAIKEGGGV